MGPTGESNRTPCTDNTEEDNCPTSSPSTTPKGPDKLTLHDFREKYLLQKIEENVPLKTKLTKYITRQCRNVKLKDCILNSFPGVSLLRRYNVRADLVSDVVAGLSVGIVQIPSSMAFAMLASLPPICGLYTAFISAIVYFLFGTSHYISVGSTATVSLIVGTAVEDHRDSFRDLLPTAANVSGNSTFTDIAIDGTSYAEIATATTLTFLVGCFLVLMGKLRFGIVTSYMPDPMLGGFLTSAMILVIISQVKVVLGLKFPKQEQPFKSFKDVIQLGAHLPETSVASLVTSAICCVVIYLVKVCVNQRYQKRLPFPIPIELFVLAVGTLISHYCSLHEEFHLDIVGDIPSGLPVPQLPPLHRTTGALASTAVTVAVIAYVISVSIAKSMVKDGDKSVNPNQEMVAIGATSLGACFLSGFAVGASLSRSVVQKSTGGRTQVASVVGSVVVLLVILLIGPLFYSLPISILSAVILVAFKGVVTQVLMGRKHWKKSKYDFTMWVATFSGVLCFGVNIGLFIGVITSLLSVVLRTQRSGLLSLGKVENSDIYVDREKYTCVPISEETSIPILYFEGPLYFANSEMFASRLLKIAPLPCDTLTHIEGTESQSCFNKKKIKKNANEESDDHSSQTPNPDEVFLNGTEASSIGLQLTTNVDQQFIILDCSGVSFIDTSGVKTLTQLLNRYEEIGTTLLLTAIRDDVVDMFIKCDEWETIQTKAFLCKSGAVEYINNFHKDESIQVAVDLV